MIPSNQGSDTAQLVQTVNLGKPTMAVAWRPDGKRFAAVGFGNLGVWETATGKRVATPAMWAFGSSVVYSPDGRILVVHKAGKTHEDMTLLAWLDAKDHHVIREIEGYPATQSMAFSPDSKLLAVGSDKYKGEPNVVTVFDTAEGNLLVKLIPAIPDGWRSAKAHRCAAIHHQMHRRLTFFTVYF